jgi:hypothetical protein
VSRSSAAPRASDVLVTAFRGNDGVLTLHTVNLGAGRKATITGIPADVRSLRAIHTSRTEGFQKLAAIEPRSGVLELELTPQSLLTLTTSGSGGRTLSSPFKWDVAMILEKKVLPDTGRREPPFNDD